MVAHVVQRQITSLELEELVKWQLDKRKGHKVSKINTFSLIAKSGKDQQTNKEPETITCTYWSREVKEKV